jgi:hypothetical protein
MLRSLVATLILVSSASLAAAQQEGTEPSPKYEVSAADRAAQEQREAEFARRLSGASLQGFFSTTDVKPGDEPPRLQGDRYDLLKVSKGEGNRWLFQSRIRYGNRDVTIPVNVPVEWAGDTPVIVVEDLTIPGMGTFTARVMFHEDHYAGYWSGGDHGGHLIGRIVREKPEEEAQSQTSPPSAQ